VLGHELPLEFQTTVTCLYAEERAGGTFQRGSVPYAVETLGTKIRSVGMIGLGLLPMIRNRNSSQTKSQPSTIKTKHSTQLNETWKIALGETSFRYSEVSTSV